MCCISHCKHHHLSFSCFWKMFYYYGVLIFKQTRQQMVHLYIVRITDLYGLIWIPLNESTEFTGSGIHLENGYVSLV